MAEVKFDFKNFFSKINLNRAAYIAAFLVSVVLVSLYTFIFVKTEKTKVGEIYDLRSQIEEFESLNSSFFNQLTKAQIHSLMYISEGMEIDRLQVITSLNDANNSYNQLFTIVQAIDSSRMPLLIEIKDKLYDLDNGYLTKLAHDVELPETDLSAIMTDEDTLSFDLSAMEAGSESDISFTAEDKRLQSIEKDLFELEALIGGKIRQIAQSKAESGLYHVGVYFLFIFLMLVTFILLYYQVRRTDLRHIQISSNQLKSISTGELPEKQKPGKDQFAGLVENSNLIMDYMHDASEFAINIGEGNFEYDFKPKSKEDKLGNALIDMQNRLQQVAREDKIRNWVNEGQARFGEILRNTGDDIEKMGDEIISNLIKYLDASLGVIYIKNEDHNETKLELLSAYAFNRKKHEERTLKVGEGLAGQVFLEQKRVFLKDIKTNHFNILTGMGESKPSSVLIVPLKQEDNIEGVLELASFNVLEEYQINFVEKIGESIATAIKSGKTSRVTNELLQEMQTREEEMRTQEEELKQNMEELSATQEQMERLRKEDEERKIELENKRKTLYQVLNNIDACVFLKNGAGSYEYVNEKYANLLSLSVDKIIGKSDDELLGDELAEQRKAWENTALMSHSEVKQKETINKKTFTLVLTSLDLPDQAEKGVLGVMRE